VRAAKLEYDLGDGFGVRTKWVDFARRMAPHTANMERGRIHVHPGTRMRDLHSVRVHGVAANEKLVVYTKPMGSLETERLVGTGRRELMRSIAFGERDFDVCLGRFWLDLSHVEKQTGDETKADVFTADVEWRDAIGNTINVVYEPTGHKDEKVDTFTLTTNMGTEAQVYTNASTSRYFVEVVRHAASEKISMRVYDAAGWVTTPEINL
jgi:hypothetical protein